MIFFRMIILPESSCWNPASSILPPNCCISSTTTTSFCVFRKNEYLNLPMKRKAVWREVSSFIITIFYKTDPKQILKNIKDTWKHKKIEEIHKKYLKSEAQEKCCFLHLFLYFFYKKHKQKYKIKYTNGIDDKKNILKNKMILEIIKTIKYRKYLKKLGTRKISFIFIIFLMLILFF